MTLRRDVAERNSLLDVTNRKGWSLVLVTSRVYLILEWSNEKTSDATAEEVGGER